MKSNVVRRSIILATVILLALVSLLSGCASSGVSVLTAQQRLRVATTTSLYDTGLWGYLEPMFEKEYDVQLDVISVGSAVAFDWGRRGDVDVITIHSKAAELQFIADGYGVERVIFAYNHFIIVGPADDPAGIKDLAPEAAFQKIFETGTTKFVSRGDQSGTHTKEQAIWKAAGYDYTNTIQTASWYVNASGGMGQTLEMASELNAYTLSDIGTFLAYQSNINVVSLVDQGSIMLNVYSVIVVKNTKMLDMANNMVTFLTSPEIQKLIGEYGVKDFGQQLFTPCAGQTEPTE
jgi:tungstate transport system substrate-binding protein